MHVLCGLYLPHCMYCTTHTATFRILHTIRTHCPYCSAVNGTCVLYVPQELEKYRKAVKDMKGPTDMKSVQKQVEAFSTK